VDVPDLVPPRRTLSRWLASPALHFLLIGGILYAASAAITARDGAQSGIRIVVRANDLERLAREWSARTGRLPDEATQRVLLRSHVDDELLLHEATSLGWDRSDPVVIQRLVRNQRFLEPESTASDSELLARAYEQGMDRSDVVVRRRLLERMRLAIAETAREPEPSEAELADHLARNATLYEQPARVRVSHVFLSRDRRGSRLAGDARALLQRLRAEAVPPESAPALGDAFLIGHHLPEWSEETLARRLGPDFARAALAAPVGAWSDPVESGYGMHLLWIHVHTPARQPELSEVRREVRAAVLREREEAALREHLAELRGGARIVLAGPNPSLLPAATLDSEQPFDSE
jgi:hypothetical protein